MNYYDILGIPNKSLLEDIKKAYKKLALKYHPDKPHGNRDKFEQISKAYSHLSDKSRKDAYDASLVDDAALGKIFSSLFDTIFTKVAEIKRNKHKSTSHTSNPTSFAGNTNANNTTAKNWKPNDSSSPNDSPSKKVKTIRMYVRLTLDEVYRGDIKQVLVRLRRGDTWIKKPFYINTMEHKSKYIYSDQGDEEYGEKGDLEINVTVLEHEKVKKGYIMGEYDLYIYETISLYEYYTGVNSQIKILNNETVNVKLESNAFKDNNEYVHIVEQHGLPYLRGEDILYGNLYIYFKLYLPKCIENESHMDSIKTYFNVNGRSS